MAEIKPFRGLRFAASAGNLDSLVAPPYDVVTPAERIALGAHSPNNIVHLTLPEGKIDDRSKFVKYARSSALLSQWRREKILVPDETPSLYRLTQHFEVGAEREQYVRSSLLCILKLEPFANGVVLPHEQTFPSHKEDRLRLLESTRTHLESIFGLFEDSSGDLIESIRSAPVGAKVESHGQQLRQSLEPIVDAAWINQTIDRFAGMRIWIADGHHRYETALSFREALGTREVAVAEDYILIALSSMADPGLVLMPTHRIVPSLKELTVDDFFSRLGGTFHLEKCHSTGLILRLREAEAAGTMGFGIGLEGGHGIWLKPLDIDSLVASLEGAGSEKLRKLDTTILHRVILERLLGVSPSATIHFERDAAHALLFANEGGGAAFLMSPPTVEDMKEIALAGDRMPHKSTYYYPKIWSGFTAWALEDFQG